MLAIASAFDYQSWVSGEEYYKNKVLWRQTVLSLVLSDYRKAPMKHGLSPADILCNRKLRTGIFVMIEDEVKRAGFAKCQTHFCLSYKGRKCKGPDPISCSHT